MTTRIYLRDQNDVVFDVIDHGEYFGDTINRYLQGKASIFTLKIIKRDKDYQRIKAGIRISFMLDDGEEFWMNCVKVEQDEKFLTMTCLSLGLELNNEQIGPYKSPKAMTIAEYIDVIDFEKVLTIRANEVSDKKISYEWTGTESKLARLFSLAKVFSAEIEFSTKLNSNGTLKSIIVDIYKEHDDKNQGIGNDRRTSTFYFGEEIKTIRKTEDIYDLYTCILPTGENGLTISNVEKEVFDDDGKLLYATYRTAKPDFPDVRKIYAVQAREQFPSTTSGNDRWIAYSPEQTQYKDENALYGYALSELKKNCVPKVTWEIEGYIDAKIGDTVRIADESYTPTLYLEARIVEQEISITDKTKNKSTFSNVKELESQISSDLLAQMEALIKANKTWNTTLSTDNGTFFKNSSDETTITARVFDGALDITDNATFNWYKDGVFAGVSKSFKVLASEIDTKSVYKVEVYDQYGNVRSQNELTITKVKDGQPGKTPVVHLAWADSADGQLGFSTTNASGKLYMGTCTDYIQSDPTDYRAYTWVKIKGDKGETGATGPAGRDGKGVKSYKITYQAGTSGTTPPTGTWSSTIPTVPKGQYLWSKTTLTYTDNTTSDTYSVAYFPVNGETGNGISSYTAEFYLSTSKTTQSGGSWTTTPPTWSSGKYLWTRYKIGYTNGSTAYTTPHCSSEWEAVNDIQVGGRNLVKKTGEKFVMGYGIPNTTWEDGRAILRYGSGNNPMTKTEILPQNGAFDEFVLKRGVVYTQSLIVETDATFVPNGAFNFTWFRMTEPQGHNYKRGNIKKTGNEQYLVWCTASVNEDNFQLRAFDLQDLYQVLSFNISGSYIAFSKPKLEEGNMPTAWSPAPEDTQDQIDQANINISNKVDQEAYNKDKQIIYDDISKKLDDEEFRKFQKTMNDLKSSYESFVGEGGRYEKELQNASKREQAIIQEFGEKVQQFNFINTYIRESEEGIVIGAKGNPMQMLLSKDSLSFMDGGQTVAYFSNQSFYINRGAVVESLQVGVHKLTKIDNNHTVIQYIPQ